MKLEQEAAESKPLEEVSCVMLAETVFKGLEEEEGVKCVSQYIKKLSLANPPTEEQQDYPVLKKLANEV